MNEVRGKKIRKTFRSIGQALIHLLTVDGLDSHRNQSTPTNSYVVTEIVLLGTFLHRESLVRIFPKLNLQLQLVLNTY